MQSPIPGPLPSYQPSREPKVVDRRYQGKKERKYRNHVFRENGRKRKDFRKNWRAYLCFRFDE